MIVKREHVISRRALEGVGGRSRVGAAGRKEIANRVYERLDGVDGEVRFAAHEADGRMRLWSEESDGPVRNCTAYERGWEIAFGAKE